MGRVTARNVSAEGKNFQHRNIRLISPGLTRTYNYQSFLQVLDRLFLLPYDQCRYIAATSSTKSRDSPRRRNSGTLYSYLSIDIYTCPIKDVVLPYGYVEHAEWVQETMDLHIGVKIAKIWSLLLRHILRAWEGSDGSDRTFHNFTRLLRYKTILHDFQNLDRHLYYI